VRSMFRWISPNRVVLQLGRCILVSPFDTLTLSLSRPELQPTLLLFVMNYDKPKRSTVLAMVMTMERNGSLTPRWLGARGSVSFVIG
jgi:hypothetical protein